MADYSDLGFEPAGNAHADLGFVPTPARIPGVVEQVGTSLHNQAKGIFDMLHGLVDPEVAMKIGEGQLDAQTHEWQRAKENYAKGDYVGAMTGALGAAIPIIGPFINQTAEKLATEGKRAEGATDILAPLVAGAAIANAPEAAAATRGAAGAAAEQIPALLKGVNPLQHPLKVIPDVVDAAKAVVQGGKEGLADYRYSQIPKGPSERYAGPEPIAEPLPDLSPIPGTLPSGRVPGGIQNQVPITQLPKRPSAAPTIPEGVNPAIWQRLPPDMQQQLRELAAAHPPAAPAAQVSPEPPATTPGIGNGEVGRPPLAETPGRIPEDTALTEKLRQLNREWAIKAGLDPDQHLGMLKGGQYTARFDAGDPNSPIIDSTKRKPYSTAEVANPQLIIKAAADKVGGKLAGIVSPEQFDKMVKNPAVRDIISNLAGQEADAKLLSAIRRRIAKNPGQAPTGYTIADLMKDIK